METDLSEASPRVLIVSRRWVRKNKFVDFVGEYHLDLIVRYGAVPVIIPRVKGIHMLLESFEPIHGVLLCEGEDVDPSLYNDSESPEFSPEELAEIWKLHSSDTAVDKEKDSIELRLVNLCLERNIPFLGICRGSQILNVASGGTLYRDIGKEMSKKVAENRRVLHMNYDDYDGHRHPVSIVKNTPMHRWFSDSLVDGEMEIQVNSYHHQGIKRLAPRFTPMAYSPDGLVEGFFDEDSYNPGAGKFIIGLQFHPERMRRPDSDEFEYPGCASAYKEFVTAVIAYQKKLKDMATVYRSLNVNGEMEKKMKKKRRRLIVRSFSVARNMYVNGQARSELEDGEEFLESNIVLNEHQETRLKQMGATVRNANSYMETLKSRAKKEKLGRVLMGRMPIEELIDLLSFYHMMGKICKEELDTKLHSIVNHQKI